MHAILDRTQTEEAIVCARSRVLAMADKAISRIEKSIESEKREGLHASLAVLKGVGVFEERMKSHVEMKTGFEHMSDDKLRAFVEGRLDSMGYKPK